MIEFTGFGFGTGLAIYISKTNERKGKDMEFLVVENGVKVLYKARNSKEGGWFEVTINRKERKEIYDVNKEGLIEMMKAGGHIAL